MRNISQLFFFVIMLIGLSSCNTIERKTFSILSDNGQYKRLPYFSLKQIGNLEIEYNTMNPASSREGLLIHGLGMDSELLFKNYSDSLFIIDSINISQYYKGKDISAGIFYPSYVKETPEFPIVLPLEDSSDSLPFTTLQFPINMHMAEFEIGDTIKVDIEVYVGLRNDSSFVIKKNLTKVCHMDKRIVMP